MDNNNKTNQGQNDLNKKPGTDKVANPGQGNLDQGKNLNKTPGQNQKIGQDDLGGQRQVSNKPVDRQDDVQQSDIDKGNKQRPNIDRDSQK